MSISDVSNNNIKNHGNLCNKIYNLLADSILSKLNDEESDIYKKVRFNSLTGSRRTDITYYYRPTDKMNKLYYKTDDYLDEHNNNITISVDKGEFDSLLENASKKQGLRTLIDVMKHVNCWNVEAMNKVITPKIYEKTNVNAVIVDDNSLNFEKFITLRLII